MQILFLFQAAVFIVIFVILYLQNKESKKQSAQTLSDVLFSFESVTEKFFENTKEMQIKHFSDLEKHSAKQLGLLEKNSKLFLEAITKITRPAPTVTEQISALDNKSRENTIEEAEVPDIQLDETMRIPIVEGVNFQFEGEEEIIPFNPE